MHQLGRKAWWLVPLVVLASPAAGLGATLLFVEGDVYPLSGGQRLLAAPDDLFQVLVATPSRVGIAAVGDSSFWMLSFGGPNGEALAPGTYEGATRFGGTTPELDVGGEGVGCNTSTGRFVVHEATFGPGDELLAFSADFERQCDGDSAPIRGALRYRIGDETCAGAPDSTPCDDGNPCTSADACAAGVCAGTDDVTPGCTAGGPCLPAGVCDPASGACTTTTRPDGTTCDDGSACTTGETCDAGVCGAGMAVSCDDADPCTTDQCVPATGCVHAPVDGTCWTTRGVVRAVASASAEGRTARCTLRCEAPGTGVLILGADGTYRVPSGNYLPCPSVSTTPLPDEVGTVRPKRRRKLVLEPANLDELLAVAAECFDEVNPFRRYRASLRLSRDGTTFTGRATLRGRQPGRIPVHLKSTVRLTGADVTTGIEPPPPSRKTLPTCSDALEPRCRVY